MENAIDFFQKWEKENNPFFPGEMRWDRSTVNELLAAYEKAKKTALQESISGWVVINRKHATTLGAFINYFTFKRTRSEAINSFIEGTGHSWKYWRKKYNFSCERATQTIKINQP